LQWLAREKAFDMNYCWHWSWISLTHPTF
jgi:hypothetical protein